MNNLQNLHTHSTFCDGKDTPEEMILAAIDKGFGSIGFSGHSYMSFSKYMTHPRGITEQYKREVRRLAEKYKGVIDVYCGIEFEMLSDDTLEGFDYLIGSVHYFLIDGVYVGFDRSADVVRSVIDGYFGGDGMKYAKAYYESLARLPEYGRFDILGHFDLITKHADSVCFFDQESAEYRRAAFGAIDALAGKIPFFEVNTGAIARGYRKTPYPTADILKELKAHGFGAVVSSDCHDARMLDCGFADACELLADCGFKEKYILTDKGFKAVPLFD